jgi:hypothetical protein
MRRTAQVMFLPLMALTTGLARAQALKALASSATKYGAGKAKKTRFRPTSLLRLR